MSGPESVPGGEGAPKEIERKFLVSELPPNLDQYEHKAIQQGYLAIDPNGTEVRVRDKGGKHTMTVKSKGDLTRGERESPISSEQFDIFWPATEGRRVEKTRYTIPHQGHTIELDIYEGNLQGLVTAEVEFGDWHDADDFTPPEWFSGEVTYDDRFKNQQLAQFGIPT